MARKKNKKAATNTIALNRKARRDYSFDEKYEAGIALEGWEVKSLRAGRGQLRDAYVMVKDAEAWLVGALITPLPEASTHIQPEPRRTRKLLLHRREIERLRGAIDRKGYTLIATAMYWKKARAKVEIQLGKGRKDRDKREVEKGRDWQRQKERLLKTR